MSFTPWDRAEHDYTETAFSSKPLKEIKESEYRHVIHRNTGVLRGVWGSNMRETLVVDNNEAREVYQSVLVRVKGIIGVHEQQGRPVGKRELFKIVSKVCQQTLYYSLDAVEDIYFEAGGTPGVRIALSDYMEMGVGVCRHQGLLAAVIIQMLKQEGRLEGWVHVHRSFQFADDGDAGGHAWARHNDLDGEAYIIDPTNGFVGTLEEAKNLPYGWNYEMPEDKMREEVIREVGQLGILGESSPVKQYYALSRWYIRARYLKKL